MTANVAESAKHAIFVANNDDGFTYEIGGEKAFRIGDAPLHAVHFPARPVKCADELPGAPENARLLDFQNCWIGVETRGERLRALDLFVHVQVQWFRDHKRKFRTCAFPGVTSARRRFWIRLKIQRRRVPARE